MLASLVLGAVPASPVVPAAVGISQLQSAELQGPEGAAGDALAVRFGVDSSCAMASLSVHSAAKTVCSDSIGVDASMLLASAMPPPLKAEIKTTQQRAITVRMQRVTPHNCGQHGATAVADKDRP